MTESLSVDAKRLLQDLNTLEALIFQSEMSCTLSSELVQWRKQRANLRAQLADQGIFA